MLASALAFSMPGKKVGLYTSPHLLDFRERIRIVSTEYDTAGVCCREIGRDDVVDFLARSSAFIDRHRPSFFEITTAMALDYFRRMKVDVAIVETGLGGRLDSTNIITPELSIITSIGLDHKDILGDTIGKIAAEKAGIIKPRVPVVVGELPEEAMTVINARAGENGSSLYRSMDVSSDNTDPAETAKEGGSQVCNAGQEHTDRVQGDGGTWIRAGEERFSGLPGDNQCRSCDRVERTVGMSLRFT